MAYKKITDTSPPTNEDIIVVIKRKTLGADPVRYERHVGKLSGKGLWVIGNYFGFDLGEVYLWDYIEDIPLDLVEEVDNEINGKKDELD